VILAITLSLASVRLLAGWWACGSVLHTEPALFALVGGAFAPGVPRLSIYHLHPVIDNVFSTVGVLPELSAFAI
jgi:hypothetical protein